MQKISPISSFYSFLFWVFSLYFSSWFIFYGSCAGATLRRPYWLHMSPGQSALASSLCPTSATATQPGQSPVLLAPESALWAHPWGTRAENVQVLEIPPRVSQSVMSARETTSLHRDTWAVSEISGLNGENSHLNKNASGLRCPLVNEKQLPTKNSSRSHHAD